MGDLLFAISERNQELQFKISKDGHVDQGQTANNVDPKPKDLGLKFKMGAGPLGFEPRTFSLEGRQDVDLKAYREYYLDKKIL